MHRCDLLGKRRWVPDAAERRRVRLRWVADGGSGNGDLRESLPARAAAHVEFARDQSRAAHRRLRRLPHALGRRRDAGQPDAQSRSRHRAVRADLPAQRRHSRQPDLSLRELGVALDGAAQLERVDDLRHRRAQHEVRLSGHLLRRRRAVLHQRREGGVPPQQRRAEPDHADAALQPAQAAHALSRRSTRRSSGRWAA